MIGSRDDYIDVMAKDVVLVHGLLEVIHGRKRLVRRHAHPTNSGSDNASEAGKALIWC
jgi:hypothetical protein